MLFIPKRIVLLLLLLVSAASFAKGQSTICGSGSRTSHSTRSMMTECFLLSSSSSNSSICHNTAPNTKVDDSCMARHPMCMQASGWQPPASVVGDFCAKCINIYDSDIDVDLRFIKTFPCCHAPFGLASLDCLALEILTCQNTVINATTDHGCADDAPMCYNAATKMDVMYGAGRTSCGHCINTFLQGHHNDVGWADYGCPVDSPCCIDTDGKNDALLNQIGVHCCPASGCDETSATCPCNTPNSYFWYIV